MDFKQLAHIALEGGGGKGAVYKGAIRALEKIMYEEWIDKRLVRTIGGQAGKEPDAATIAAFRATGFDGMESFPPMLDYDNPGAAGSKIRGISGSSAGAITALPLSLGLTSADIEAILKSYPFEEEFLPNNRLNVGKYRMVGMGVEGGPRILIAEDSSLFSDGSLRSNLPGKAGKPTMKKLGDHAIVPFLFGGKQKIGSNGLKEGVRSVIIHEILQIIFNGLKYRIKPIQNFLESLQKYLDYPREKLEQALQFVNTLVAKFIDVQPARASHVAIASGILYSILKGKLIGLIKKIDIGPNRWKVLDFLPANHLVPAIGNLLWDRGIYAGFEVREFFYQILLLALSKDSRFKRGLLEDSALLDQLGISPVELDHFQVAFNEPPDESDPELRSVLVRLSALPELLTFRKLYALTGVNLGVCVTNATTNQPIYFTHYFTPDFPVLEAVGAAMSFPMAFKPVYNEANVLRCPIPFKIRKDQEVVPQANPARPIDVFQLKPHPGNRRYFTDSFTMRDFNYYLGVVIRYLIKVNASSITVNNNLSFRSLLPYLRREIATGKFERFENFDGSDLQFLCYFFYNSAFKGILFDGGVTNNLPVGIHTFLTDAAAPADATTGLQDLTVKKSVLSLKLDRTFPETIRTEAFDLLKNDRKAKLLVGSSGPESHPARMAFAKKIFQKVTLRRAHAAGPDIEFGAGLSKAAWINVADELIEEYKDTQKGFTPWNQQVNFMSALINSLSFGMDQGQIEDITDNENIIPLFCFGVGTLDFDLSSKKIEPLVELAIKESENSVLEYFGR